MNVKTNLIIIPYVSLLMDVKTDVVANDLKNESNVSPRVSAYMYQYVGEV